MYDRKPKSARDILKFAETVAMLGVKPTYIVCGKIGPTGKTWLCNELRKAGHTAIEISEGLVNFVNYCDDENHMRRFGFDQVMIVLNKPLSERWKL